VGDKLNVSLVVFAMSEFYPLLLTADTVFVVSAFQSQSDSKFLMNLLPARFASKRGWFQQDSWVDILTLFWMNRIRIV
jgi:hypothetical protein